MNILKEKQEIEEDMLRTLKSTIINFWKNIKDAFSHPKENSEEYKRLKEFLWNDFERHSKHWTIKRAKTAKIIIEKRIINRDDILKWQCMDKWNKNSIETAKKLKDIGMEIKPTDWIYMWHRTPERIEWLKKWKDEHWDTLSYTYSRSREWTVTKELKPKDWDKIKSSYWV